MDITQLLAFSVKNKASDLHLSAGLPPMIRVHGDVRRINVEPLDHKTVHAMVYDIMNDAQRKLRNLVDNALKFTPADRHPEIRISAIPDGAMVNLSVSDNGQGFDMKYHDRIFGMFQRLHRQDQIPGTGIGLALVLKAVERMGGTIRAESAPGQGARFEIELPRA